MIKIVPTFVLKMRAAWLRYRVLDLADRREAHLVAAGAINEEIRPMQKSLNAINATIASREPPEKLLAPFQIEPGWVRLGGHRPPPTSPKPSAPPPGQGVRP